VGILVSDFDYHLPPDLVAQEPARDRTAARLLHLDRASGALEHTLVSALPKLLKSGDVVVVNDTRVFPARLLGRRVPSGGAVECLLVGRVDLGSDGGLTPGTIYPGSDPRLTPLWEALVHPGQKLKVGARLDFEGNGVTLHGEIVGRGSFGRRVIRLWLERASGDDSSPSVDEVIDAIGHVPLPPYIRRGDSVDDRERYQTVFAVERGSVAAPTAGLHFNDQLVRELRQGGVQMATLTLHVGYGTFQPVRVDRVEDHRLESERYEIKPAAVATVNRALDEGRRVISVGTTTTRTLEAVAAANAGRLVAGAGRTDLFIYPGFEFRVVRGLITNFHVPRSSLLMLVCAFAGRERTLTAYAEAVDQRYRFYSYGDAMFIT
jgi:S-adenosylmethionine:tRNA ribosyltransferase-isomerase